MTIAILFGQIATRNACLVATGLQNPSSVRIAPTGGDFDVSGKALTLWITEFSGAIRTVGYTPPLENPS